MKEHTPVQKIGDFSFFVTGIDVYENTILNYDLKMANLTIVWEPFEAQIEPLEEELEPLTIAE